MSGDEADSNPVTEGLFVSQDGETRLLCSHCDACGQDFFPRSGTCPYCAATRVRDVEHDGRGSTLWAWTAVNAAPPGYDGPVPYGLGVVEVPDGMRVVTRLTESDPEQLTFGMPMELTVDLVHSESDGSEVVAWAFAPEGRSTP